MSVYVEVVFLNNLAMDALIVALTLTLRRRRARRFVCTLAAVLAAVAATAYAVVPAWAKAVTAVVLAPAMSLALHRLRNFADYITTLAVLVGVTFALGGTVYGISYLVGFDLRGYPILGICAAAGFVAVLAVRAFAASRGKAARRILNAVISVCGAEITVTALCDSGNTLTDIASGLPVLIASRELSQRLRCVEGARVEGFVEAATVGGQLSLPIMRLGSVTVDGRSTQAYAALTERRFDGYEAILQNTMFGGDRGPHRADRSGKRRAPRVLRGAESANGARDGDIKEGKI